MQTVNVALGERSYDICIGSECLAKLPRLVAELLRPTSIAIVCDHIVAELYGRRTCEACRSAGLATSLIPFPAGEESKNLGQAEEICKRMFAAGLDRRSSLVALGGGVTGDLAGFAAAIYMRGISFVQAPTTLLAQVDSSVGGKTGVNLPGGKNLVGVFHQPAAVFADIRALHTLPVEEMRWGLAEAIKHGIIRDAAYLQMIEQEADKIEVRDEGVLEDLVAGSCRIKAAVVGADERESGLRAILNFGHTFGHAYEALSGYTLPHGEAVAMGMLAACRLAERLRGCDRSVRERLQSLLRRFGFSLRPPPFNAADALACMRGDKKAQGGRRRFVLPLRLGEVEVVEVEDESAIVAALRLE